MTDRELTKEAQAERDRFEDEYGDGNCSCHISPPCNSCIHPGNPLNQDEDDMCWIDAPLDGLIVNSTGPIQPQINTGLDLLIAGHQIHDGPMIDIYGETDTGYGCEAQDICLTGTTVSLYGLVSERLVDGQYQGNELLQSLSAMCDDILPSAKEMREAARVESLIDRAEERRELQA